MLEGPKNQFSFTRGALSTTGPGKAIYISNILFAWRGLGGRRGGVPLSSGDRCQRQLPTSRIVTATDAERT
jgi:hypothetical protein